MAIRADYLYVTQPHRTASVCRAIRATRSLHDLVYDLFRVPHVHLLIYSILSWGYDSLGLPRPADCRPPIGNRLAVLLAGEGSLASRAGAVIQANAIWPLHLHLLAHGNSQS